MTRRNFLTMLGVIACAAISASKIPASQPAMNRSKRIEKLKAQQINSFTAHSRYVAINSGRQKRYATWLNEK